MSSSLQQSDLESLCNVDPSVVALLRPLPEDATTQEVGLRTALIKLQQATLRGNSTYASKLLEMSLQDIQRDKHLHEMLGSYQKELEQRDTYYGTPNKDDNSAAKNSTKAVPSNQVGIDDEGNSVGGNKNEEENVDSMEIVRLKESIQQEVERANALEDKLEKVLLEQIEQIKEEQESIRNRQSSLRNRIRSLRSSIHDLPEPCSIRLQNALGETYSGNNNTLAGASNSCTVCQDADAVRAIIPCGHLCLCDDCTNSLATSPNKSMQQCPLCRGNLLSTLKIYTAI